MSDASDRLRSAGGTVVDRLTSTRAKLSYAVIVTLAAVSVVLYLSYLYNGAVATAVYAFVFLVCATGLPMAISLLGDGVPFSTALGRGHIVLGAFAFGTHYLVQREDGYEWCPGDEQQVYIDGEYHPVSGREHMSVLGWRPFGILRYKDDDTWAPIRGDTDATDGDEQAVSDGGAAVERGGYEQTERPIVSGVDGDWLVDLKKLYTPGLLSFGDIDVIEVAEQIIERGQVNAEQLGGSYRPFIETVVGLILGLAAGGLYLAVA